MNNQTIAKVIVTGVLTSSISIMTSCAPIDPGYAAYKKQQQAQAAAAAAAANPYGAPTAGTTGTAANPYSVPGANGETGAPYQPIPGVPDNPPVVQNIPAPSQPTQPYTPLPSEPSITASTHTVVKGDTIWGLTRKYGVTGDSLRQANNLTSDTIWVGQRLVIPGR